MKCVIRNFEEGSLEFKKGSYFMTLYSVHTTWAGSKPRITPTFPIITIKQAKGPTRKAAKHNIQGVKKIKNKKTNNAILLLNLTETQTKLKTRNKLKSLYQENPKNVKRRTEEKMNNL